MQKYKLYYKLTCYCMKYSWSLQMLLVPEWSVDCFNVTIIHNRYSMFTLAVGVFLPCFHPSGLNSPDLPLLIPFSLTPICLLRALISLYCVLYRTLTYKLACPNFSATGFDSSSTKPWRFLRIDMKANKLQDDSNTLTKISKILSHKEE